jgi:hypothetical protein
MKALALCACLLCPSAVLLAKTQPEVQTAKVISQDVGSYNGGSAVVPVGGMLVGVPITRRSDMIVLETVSHRLTLSELITRHGAVILPVNGTVQFYQEGNWFIVLDSDKKKHKFSLVHMEALK